MEDDFSNKTVWKKQTSQDGREYYVNLVSGIIKYPPKQPEKKVDGSEKKSLTEEHYIQQYTVDKVPFFVNMKSGVSSWTLPEGTPLSAVKYITHLTPEGIPYYEDTEKKTTSWTLPVEKLSTSARRSSVALVKMNRRQSNVFMASQEHVDPVGTATDNPNNQESQGSDAEDGESGLFKSRARNRVGSRTGLNKSGAQPRRYSNMAQKSQQNLTRSNSPPPRENVSMKGIVGMADVRSMRATQRQQSITKLNCDPDPGNDEIVTAPESRKPFANASQRDSPTISDVSSVTAPSNNPPPHIPHEASNAHVGETKPLVRQIFERYEKNKCGWISLSNLQELCYDFGTYLSEEELHLAISEIDVDRDGRLTYEEFMVWWRTNDQFSTMKLSDAHTKLRTDCAAVYKRYDRGMEGNVTRQEFAKIHRELVREKLVKLDLDTCVSILDSKGDGVVYFNDFISWVERGQLSQPAAKSSAPTEPIQKQKSLAKFFGSLLGGNQDNDSKSTPNENLVPVKDHPDYAKYFRMASVGGNVMDIRRQMREAGLDENLIHTPEKLISAKSQQIQSDHLKQATLLKTENAAFGSYSNIAESPKTQDSHVDDRAFTSMFKKKAQSPEPESTVKSSVIEVFLSKPLGITLGENVEDEEKGVHVSSCAAGGNAANTGIIEPGMLLLEACGQDVRFKDFDSVMDILRNAPAGEKIKLVFSKPGDVSIANEPADSDVSETSSVEKSVLSQQQNSNINEALEPNDTDVSETSSVDKSIIKTHQPLFERKPSIQIALEPNDTDLSETSSVDKSIIKTHQPLFERKPSIQIALEPNDTDVSETSSLDRSLAEKPLVVSVASGMISEEYSHERRDSLKSVSSTHSSQTSHVSRRSEAHDSENAKTDSAASNPPVLSTKVIPSRTSFASRKAAAIRNAASRKRGNSFVQTDPLPPDHVSDEEPAVVSTTTQSLNNSSGIFGLANAYDSDTDDASPILSQSGGNAFPDEEWRNNEPVISIPNPHTFSSTSTCEAPPELENSQIIGRPRGPKRHLPSILNRMRRQQSGESKPERGGIARVSSKSIEELPVSREESDPSPPIFTSNPLSMSDIGTTGSGKVPIPAALIQKSTAFEVSKQVPGDDKSIESRGSESSLSLKKDDRSASSRRSEVLPQSQGNNAINAHNVVDQKSIFLPSKRFDEIDLNEKQQNQQSSRITPVARPFRGMRSFGKNTRMETKNNLSLKQGGNSEHDIPSNEDSPVPTPKLSSRVRRDNLLIQGRDSDHESDSSSFSPQQVHKTIGSFSPKWNVTPPSMLKSRSHLHTSEVSESETNSSNYFRVPNHQHVQPRIKTVNVGVQSDYAAYIDEQYLNSYQMLLGERQELDYLREMFHAECEERLEMLREEELSLIERIRQREVESFDRIHNEEDRLTARVREVENIIMNEKEEIMKQWQELHHAELEAHETHRQKTTELLELMHIVRAHHDKLQADKKKIGRQRLQLDMALQDLNKFNHFTPHQSSPSDLKSSQRRGNSTQQPYSPGMTISSARRAVSPSPFLTSHSSHIPWNNSPSRAPSRDRSYVSTK